MLPSILPRQIQADARIELTRTLPQRGEFHVRKGDHVGPDQTIGQYLQIADYTVLNLATALGLEHPNPSEVMLKHEGDAVEAGDILAKANHRLHLLNRVPGLTRRLKSPVAGRLQAISGDWVVLEHYPTIIDVPALVHGKVTAVEHGRQITIDCSGTIIEATGHIGGECYGLLKDNAIDLAGDEMILEQTPETATILLLAGVIDTTLLERAQSLGYCGVIAGSIHSDVRHQQPAVSIPVVATEGYGEQPMAPTTLAILQATVGQRVSLLNQADGNPLIVSTNNPTNLQATPPPSGQVSVGNPVRVSSALGAARWGTIATIDPETTHQGAMIDTAGLIEFVPWQNMEHVA